MGVLFGVGVAGGLVAVGVALGGTVEVAEGVCVAVAVGVKVNVSVAVGVGVKVFVLG